MFIWLPKISSNVLTRLKQKKQQEQSRETILVYTDSFITINYKQLIVNIIDEIWVSMKYDHTEAKMRRSNVCFKIF